MRSDSQISFHAIAVESIGPAPAQFIYCAASDKMRTQIASTNWLSRFRTVPKFEFPWVMAHHLQQQVEPGAN
jgi:hypothetical protein